MTLATAEQNKEIYGSLHDQIITKRFRAASPIRRFVHRSQYGIFADLVPAGSTVLDAGCGEGILSVMLAAKGCTVTGVDLSEPNIEAAKKYAAEEGASDRTTFMVGDIEHMSFPDKSFDYVVSSHVLEHVPDFQQGARELGRLAKKEVMIAIPTCLNPTSMTLLGGDKYWTISRKTLYGLPVGFVRVMWGLITGQEGVNEGYAGMEELIHLRRFPWRAKKSIEKAGLKVKRYRGSSYAFPYVPFLLPLSKLLAKGAWLPVFRECGHGVTFVCEPLRRLS